MHRTQPLLGRESKQAQPRQASRGVGRRYDEMRMEARHSDRDRERQRDKKMDAE